jgi:type VI secretion system protein ImpG
LYLNGEGTPIYRLHELLSTSVSSIRVRPLRGVLDEPARVLPSGRIEPVGFAPDESLLPYSDRSFPGYRLLQEYFHFPEKFLFVDILGLGEGQLADCGSGFELVVLFRDSELREEIPSVSQAISKETFQLGCTPIVNLFERQSEPIRVTHTSAEYRVIGDRHREATTEIYSIDGVISAAAYSERVRRYEPFYSFRHDYSEAQPACFWYAQRRPSTGKDDAGTDVYLSLVDANFNPAVPPDELISAYVTCTNRDLASHLNWRREWRELQGEGLAMVEARCLVKPTATVRPPMRGSLQWRLISHLALNRLSITRGGLEALREILRLYSFHEDEDIRKRIDGLTALNSHSSVSGVEFDSGVAFCRGLDVEVEFDEERFAGSSAYMLASVLERFFGLYSAVNSYTRLTARSKQRRLPICRWPARIAEQRVL